MKNFVFISFIFLIGCSKNDDLLPIPKPIIIKDELVIENYNLIPKGYYIGKTSYELKTPYDKIINIDSIRKNFAILNKGLHNGTNNLGYCYVDLNNDGLEDIFYPYTSDGKNNMRPDIFLNKGNKYIWDNSILPDDYMGNQVTRKTIVGDYNNDSLPDLFLCNSGWEDFNLKIFALEENTLLLSNKITGKYELGKLPNIGKRFWHGAASGDLNGDKNIDIIVTEGTYTEILYGDGRGNFNNKLFEYKNGNGYITTEIIDVNKDGNNDIILAGDEGRPAPAIYSKSTIFWNNGNTFNMKTIICEPSTIGWGLVMDIILYDLDNDGINEILLNRTGDNTKTLYGGYNISIYKTNDNYNTFIDKSEQFIINNISNQTMIGGWITRMIVKKENELLTINCDISPSTTTNYKPIVKRWIQNKQTFKFE